MWDEYEVSLPIDLLIVPCPCAQSAGKNLRRLCRVLGEVTMSMDRKVMCGPKQRKETKEPTRLLLEGAVEVTIDIKKII